MLLGSMRLSADEQVAGVTFIVALIVIALSWCTWQLNTCAHKLGGGDGARRRMLGKTISQRAFGASAPRRRPHREAACDPDGGLRSVSRVGEPLCRDAP